MIPTADQIALPLDWPPVEHSDRFIVGEANRDAVEHFRRWAMWPVRATILTGPRRSGRSLLARSFVSRVGGTLYDDAESHSEEELFHAWNAAQQSSRPLVVVVDHLPPDWPITLPDLRSRLVATPVARIGQPDDQLFAALIERLFADRGLHIPREALRFIVARVTRDYYTAGRVVEAIDRHAIAERARLTLPTVRRALAAGGLIAAGDRQ